MKSGVLHSVKLTASQDQVSSREFYCCFMLLHILLYFYSIYKGVYSALQHSQLKEQYASLRVVVEESLNLNVHVDQLQDVKRNVRELRRQYGHRLVDQKEFSQDPLNESIEELHRVCLFVACW